MDSIDPPQVIGILGAGRVGTAIARLALSAGYRVKIATSKPAAENSLIIEIMTPGAQAVSAAEAATADLVILALPLHKYTQLDPQALAGKVVVDAMNYWSGTDGEIPAFAHTELSSSEVVASHLSQSLLVKSFNHIGYHEMEPESSVLPHPDRRALAVAGDHGCAKDRVMHFIEHLGFDVLDAGPLRAGRLLEPGQPLFNGRYNSTQLSQLLLDCDLCAKP